MTTATTSQLRTMLSARHDPQAWALMFEVADATGSRQTRWADAVAMSLWPSRGLGLHGYEIKASRSDWMRELKSPQKAEAICRFCDHWWLVVSDKAIVGDGELPPTWGLLAPDKKGVLKTVKEAPKLTAAAPDRMFLAALIRAAAKPAVALDQHRLRQERQAGYDDANKSNERHNQELHSKIEKLAADIAAFEKAAGFSIRNHWNYGPEAKRIGEVVRDVLAGKHNRDEDDLERIRSIAAEIVERIDKQARSE